MLSSNGHFVVASNKHWRHWAEFGAELVVTDVHGSELEDVNVTFLEVGRDGDGEVLLSDGTGVGTYQHLGGSPTASVDVQKKGDHKGLFYMPYCKLDVVFRQPTHDAWPEWTPIRTLTDLSSGDFTCSMHCQGQIQSSRQALYKPWGRDWALAYFGCVRIDAHRGTTNSEPRFTRSLKLKAVKFLSHHIGIFCSDTWEGYSRVRIPDQEGHWRRRSIQAWREMRELDDRGGACPYP